MSKVILEYDGWVKEIEAPAPYGLIFGGVYSGPGYIRHDFPGKHPLVRYSLGNAKCAITTLHTVEFRFSGLNKNGRPVFRAEGGE